MPADVDCIGKTIEKSHFLCKSSLNCVTTFHNIFDHHTFQIASVAEVTGFGKKTPMSIILSEIGVEPDLKHLS